MQCTTPRSSGSARLLLKFFIIPELSIFSCSTQYSSIWSTTLITFKEYKLYISCLLLLLYCMSKYCCQQIWYGFDRTSSLICGNKMPTRCNRGFYCRSYCSLNMFRAPLCPSSGAQEYYTVIAACGISCYGFQVCRMLLATSCKLENHSQKYHRQQPLYNTLQLLMMA